MHHYRAKRIVKAKYRETRVVNYRQDNDDFNILSACTFLDCDEYRMDYDGQIDTTRCKCPVGIQYKHESKEDIAGFISKPVVRPEYGTIYQHKGMLLQNLHCRYLYTYQITQLVRPRAMNTRLSKLQQLWFFNI